MANKVYLDDGHGKPLGKINVQITIDDYNWFDSRRRIDTNGKKEPMYSVIWRFRDLFQAKDISEISDQYEQAKRNCQAMQQRIRELETEIAELKKPKLIGTSDMVV